MKGVKIFTERWESLGKKISQVEIPKTQPWRKFFPTVRSAGTMTWTGAQKYSCKAA